MAAPRGTIWTLGAHSLGKHLVLREYLNAWLPILGQTHGRMIFLDAFAGPGEYKEGEMGSPIIALKAFRDHPARDKFKAVPTFVFIEERHDRIEHLRGLVTSLEQGLPPRSVQTICGTFSEKMPTLLDSLTDAGGTLPPCFAMLDPFGISDTPMEIIKRILAHPKSEVYISIMYEYISRFRREKAFAHLSSLYGCDEWQSCASVSDKQERRRCFFDLYKRQLKEAGAEQVLHFDLYKDKGNIHKYSIFHASHHIKASDKMKAAMWTVDPEGTFTFRGGQNEQPTLGVPGFQALRDALQRKFRGKDWVAIKAVENFVMSDEIKYHKSQLRKHALIPMENKGEIEVRPKGAEALQPGLFGGGFVRDARTYKGTELRFL